MKTEYPMTFAWLDSWSAHLIRVPSQCYRMFRIQKVGFFVIDAQAYLRWRGGDPWGAAVIPADNEEYRFWVDIPEKLFPRFKHDQHLKAERWLESWIEKNPRIVLTEIAASALHKADDFRFRVLNGLAQEPLPKRVTRKR